MCDPRLTAAVQKDWKDREMVESVHLNMLKITKFLNEFELSMRFQLGRLSTRVTQLERNLELCEAALYGAPQPPPSDPEPVAAPQRRNSGPPAPPPPPPQHMKQMAMAPQPPPPPQMAAPSQQHMQAPAPPPPPSIPAGARPVMMGMDGHMGMNMGGMNMNAMLGGAPPPAPPPAPAPAPAGPGGGGGPPRRKPPPPSRPAPPPGSQ